MPTAKKEEVDLSHLAGQDVFKIWRDEQKWTNVRIAEDEAIARAKKSSSVRAQRI